MWLRAEPILRGAGRDPRASCGNHPRAGEKLLRSGGFGLVVLDLGTADIPMPLQTPSDRAGAASSHGAGLSYRKGAQDFFSGIAGFTARSCREETQSPEIAFACRLQGAQGQAARTDLES